MFVALYWWRVHPGKEEQFRKAWRRGTELITEKYGSYGSRLHRDRDGRFVGYAEWPDELTWQKAFAQKMVYDHPETRAAFVDAIAETPTSGEMLLDGNTLIQKRRCGHGTTTLVFSRSQKESEPQKVKGLGSACVALLNLRDAEHPMRLVEWAVATNPVPQTPTPPMTTNLGQAWIQN